MALGADLQTEAHEAILEVLHSNTDVFAWGPEDIPGVARKTIEDRLAIKSEAPPRNKNRVACRQSGWRRPRMK